MITTPVYVGFDVTTIGVCAMAIMLLCGGVVSIFFLRRAFALKHCSKVVEVDGSQGELPSVSVIVYSSDDASGLSRLVPALYNQDYPGKKEFIVVDDSSNDAVHDLLLSLAIEFPSLRYTFVPRDTLNLSRKKLAITLGIKAAQNDVIVNTVSNCIPDSDKWLLRMAEWFRNPNIEVVIGYSHCVNETRYQSFDEIITSMQYLSAAIHGHPYRGDGNNLAYRKSTFFNHKGFSSSLNLHYGDDDLFVSEIASKDNTRVVLAADSLVTEESSSTPMAFRYRKLHYDFTMRLIQTLSKRWMAIVSALHYLGICAMFAAIVVTLPNLLGAIVALVTIGGVWTAEIVAVRMAADVLHDRKLMLSVPWMILWRPVVNLSYHLRNRKYRYSNYTWQRRKIN